MVGIALEGAEETGGKVEEGGDEFEGAANDDADDAEGQEDEPDQRKEQERCKRKGPADNHED